MHEVCLKGQGCAQMTRVRDLIKRENLHSRGWREDSREAVSKIEIEIDFFSRKYKRKMHTVEMSNHQDK